MDTASHILLGFTLAGLAYIDPVVGQNPALAQAIMVGTVIGSNIPDIDGASRIKGYSEYIRFHRGIAHSLYAPIVWSALITLFLSLFYGIWSHFWPCFYWTASAVIFHIFLDVLNPYGVQCLRPFTKKWVHLDILPIFDPFIFIMHTCGLLFWMISSVSPGPLFFWIYLVTFAYIGWRTIHHTMVVNKVLKSLQLEGKCHVLPTFHWFQWLFIVETKEHYYTGKVIYHNVVLEDKFERSPQDSIIEATKGTDGVRAFLSFAQCIHVTYKEIKDGYEVRWSDVRFRYNRKLPFGVEVKLDRNLNVISQKAGWRKKLWEPPFV